MSTGGLPTIEEINERQNTAQERLARLKSAHDNFVAEWDRVMREERDLLKEAHALVDKAKLSHMLNVINKLDD